MQHKLVPMQDTSQIEFKEGFVKRYSELTDWEAFKKYNLSYLNRSIRVNTLKISVEELKKRLEGDWELVPVPWCKEGFWIQGERRDVGNLVEHSLGYIYIQEAASMIPPLVLDPKPGSVVLDLCAAPGSKTTQIAQYMENKGLIIANDYKGDRLASLGINLQRCGVTCSIVTLMFGQWFAKQNIEFDYVLVDAPCSGTGTIRKSLKTLRIWNPGGIRKLSFQQKKLLEVGFGRLKKGGTLVYSTCSLEPEEDEGVVSALLEKFPDAYVEEVSLPGLKVGKPVMSFEGVDYHPDVAKTLRIWPQDNDTEGFFVAKIRKK